MIRKTYLREYRYFNGVVFNTSLDIVELNSKEIKEEKKILNHKEDTVRYFELKECQ